MAAAQDKTAGRGLVSITAAKLYFIFTGFAVQVGLPRLLDSTEAFGQYSVAMSTVSVLNNVLIASTLQSLSKRVSEAPEHAPARLRQGLGIQLVIGVLLGLSLFAAAPALADLQLDPGLEPLLQLAAAVPFVYALYAALVGTLNGQKRFLLQAKLDTAFSTLRTVGILGAAGLGMGVIGTMAGFVAAAGAILVVALLLVGTGHSGGERLPLRSWLGFMLPIAAFQLALNGILLLDIQVLKRTLTEMALADGQALSAATAAANEFVGLYRAGQTFALVPYQAILSVTFVVFPLVSQATASGDADATRRTVEAAMRFSFLVLLAMAAPISGAADGVLRVAYPDEFLPGADVLKVLVFGQSGLSLFVIGATMINAAGKPAVSTAVGAAGLVALLAGLRFALPAVGLGDDTLLVAGLATSAGPLTALLLIGMLVRARYGVFLRPLTVLRGAIAAACGWAAADALPTHSALLSLVALGCGGVCFLVALVVTGELGREDLARIKGALG